MFSLHTSKISFGEFHVFLLQKTTLFQKCVPLSLKMCVHSRTVQYN